MSSEKQKLKPAFHQAVQQKLIKPSFRRANLRNFPVTEESALHHKNRQTALSPQTKPVEISTYECYHILHGNSTNRFDVMHELMEENFLGTIIAKNSTDINQIWHSEPQISR